MENGLLQKTKAYFVRYQGHSWHRQLQVSWTQVKQGDFFSYKYFSSIRYFNFRIACQNSILLCFNSVTHLKPVIVDSKLKL